MNDRIMELAVQAGATFVNGLVELSDGQLMMADKAEVDHTDMDLDKFVELIVQECANAFRKEVDTWKEMSPYQGSIKRQGTKAIKKHFGVK